MIPKPIFVQIVSVFPLLLAVSCGQKKNMAHSGQKRDGNTLLYAKGFQIEAKESYTLLKVPSPWPGTEKNFAYALVPKENLSTMALPKEAYDAIVPVPVKKMIVTSTTHIPALESLDVLHTLIGFPGTDFISSPIVRKRIAAKKIKELGSNDNINTEVLLELDPDVLIGFGIDNANKAYEALERSGIPVVYNGDWAEQTPLGKAEWIKFFALFHCKEKEADSIFGIIESAYEQARKLALSAPSQPTVLTGGLYKDVWYVAGGNSWMAQFIEDANGRYLWSGSKKTGSIGLSVEAVLAKGRNADVWLNPSSHTSYGELAKASSHYQQFKAYQHKKVFSGTLPKGAKGGLFFYELAPQRPDLVLKDLIHTFHPQLLPSYVPTFFKPLQ